MTQLINCFTPDEIERRSFEIIEQELGGNFPFQGGAWQVARRLVHTSADFSLLDSLHIPDAAVRAGVEAIRRGATIYTDTEMARMGMPLRRLSPFGARAQCLLSQPGVAEYAMERNITRSRAGIEIAALENRLGGSILAVGNAPTAILALLDYLDGLDGPDFPNEANEAGRLYEACGTDGTGPQGVRETSAEAASKVALPALIIAMPVGFVNAAESKELLLKRPGLHCIAIRGRRGGSPLAAATVNALAELAKNRES